MYEGCRHLFEKNVISVSELSPSVCFAEHDTNNVTEKVEFTSLLVV